MITVTKKGHESWADLKGKEVVFEFWAPWEDAPWAIRMKFDHTETYHEDPRYPRYYVWGEAGGYSFWEDEEVEVTILEDVNKH